MNMTNDVVEGAKETILTPKKNLKQAQLSFKKRSAAYKPIEIKSRKRKASSSEEKQIIKVDVKGNYGVVPVKKLRVEDKEDLKQKVNAGKEKQNSIFTKEKHVLNCEVIETEIDNYTSTSLDGGLSAVLMCKRAPNNVNNDNNHSMSINELSNSSSKNKSVRIQKSMCRLESNTRNGTQKSRKLIPKQLSLENERKKLEEEKEHLKQEKERKRAAEKEERLRLKNEKEDARRKEKEEKENARRKEKEEKEDARRKEKEEKEKKRLAEIEAKNEEKRLKEEERKAKEEERKKKEEAKEEERKSKDEEKKQKDEEKRLKEQSKNAVHRKSAAAFVNFFVPKKIDSKSQPMEEEVEVLPEVDKFMAFEVKGDMCIAPLVRKEFVEENKERLDSALKNQINTSDSLYIESLKSGTYVPSVTGKTWPVVIDDDCIIVEDAENLEEGDKEVNGVTKENKYAPRKRAKLLQFYDNRRPPYWGTWRKKSQVIRPRAPFNMDKTMLEYEVDSDDEWEEIEEGESLRGSDDEESQDENYEEDNDMFVPHGYLSDEEGQDEMEDTSPEAQKAKLKLLQLEFEAERSEKQKKQKPHLIGCVWFRNSDDDPAKVGSQIAELFLPRRAVWDGELPLSFTMDSPLSIEDSPLEEPIRCKKKMVPESVIPKMITLIHGNCHKRSFLADELYNYFIQEEVIPQPSRKSISNKIKELANWIHCPVEEGSPSARRMCWYVSAEIRKTYGLEDLKTSQSKTWQYSLNSPHKQNDDSLEVTESLSSPSSCIKRFTKILSSEERQQQLLSNTAVNTSQATLDQSVTPKRPIANRRPSLTSLAPGQELPRTSRNTLLDKFMKLERVVNDEVINLVENKIGENIQLVKQSPKTLKRIKPISVPRNEIIEID